MGRSNQRKNKNKNKNRQALQSSTGSHQIQVPGRGQLHAVRTEFKYSGLLPLPEHMQAYEALLPGATERFMGLAERQSVHRQGMERTFIRLNGASQIMGTIFAGLIVLTAIAAGTYLLLQDKNVEGYVSMFTPLGVIAAVFFTTRRSWRKETAAKQQAEQG